MNTDILQVLKKADHALVLATNVGGVLIPIIKGVATLIEEVTKGGEITYTVAIKTGCQNLNDADAMFTDIITKVNAERAKANLPPLTMPKKLNP
jgi:hypothetical protein